MFLYQISTNNSSTSRSPCKTVHKNPANTIFILHGFLYEFNALFEILFQILFLMIQHFDHFVSEEGGKFGWVASTDTQNVRNSYFLEGVFWVGTYYVAKPEVI